jgi:hypothetical protein
MQVQQLLGAARGLAHSVREQLLDDCASLARGLMRETISGHQRSSVVLINHQ